ncbi:hypothetical protein [Chryseobacterium taiwanense]|nr:hypothetical protein [Chryseobacterium taiwanense]
MNKLCTVSFLLLFLLAISCKSQSYKETKTVIIPMIECYIKYKNEKNTIDSKKNIIVIGAKIRDNDNKDLSISFYFINPQLLQSFNYSNVYSIHGYKMIVDKSLNKYDVLDYAFKGMEVPYENFNVAKAPFSYSTDYWNIILNSKNEVIEILPEEKSKKIKSTLEERRVKFSKDYIDYSSL